MARVTADEYISFWHHMFEDMQQYSNEFYKQVEQNIGKHNLANTKLERVNIAEGGIFSSKREYLQVRRGDHVFHICGAPFGNGFFISWWLGVTERGFIAWLASWPFVGVLFRWLLKPLTYYKIDTALMFQSVTHDVVVAAFDAIVYV